VTQEAMDCLDTTIRTVAVSFRAICRCWSIFDSRALLVHTSSCASQDADSGLVVANPDLARSLQRTRAVLQLDMCSMSLQRVADHQPATSAQLRVKSTTTLHHAPSLFPAAACDVCWRSSCRTPSPC
jgi:hypothetical protein